LKLGEISSPTVVGFRCHCTTCLFLVNFLRKNTPCYRLCLQRKETCAPVQSARESVLLRNAVVCRTYVVCHGTRSTSSGRLTDIQRKQASSPCLHWLMRMFLSLGFCLWVIIDHACCIYSLVARISKEPRHHPRP
jgi:hypothetical protein